MIMNDFVKSGYGEWEDSELRTRCRIFWRKPEQLAEDIYDWAMQNGYKNGVCTVFELHSGKLHTIPKNRHIRVHYVSLIP